jgi:hypothetical protein
MSAISPVWLDGPLEDRQHEVDTGTLEQGTYAFQADAEAVGQAPPPVVFYTFSKVQLLNRIVWVASARNGILPYEVLFAKLATPAAQAAAE